MRFWLYVPLDGVYRSLILLILGAGIPLASHWVAQRRDQGESPVAGDAIGRKKEARKGRKKARRDGA